MIIYAFPTLGKTWVTQHNPAKYWDCESNRFAKQIGFAGGDEFDGSDDLCSKYAAVLKRCENMFLGIFISMLTHKLAKRLRGSLIVMLPKFGYTEFLRRVHNRSGDDSSVLSYFSKEQIYINKVRSIVAMCKELHIKCLFVDTVSEGMSALVD